LDYVDRITALRVDTDTDQSEIADLLNCKQSTISKYEKRRSKYKIEDLIKICEFYNVSANYILGLPQNMPYPENK